MEHPMGGHHAYKSDSERTPGMLYSEAVKSHHIHEIHHSLNASTDSTQGPIIVGIASVPETLERAPPSQDLVPVLGNAGLPRATRAVDSEHPHGQRLDGHSQLDTRTVLQQHVDYFDLNQDGIIQPWETWIAFRRLGYNFLSTFVAVLFIHTTMSFSSCPDWWPRPTLPIFIRHIHHCKHGSDTGVYDTEGRFVPEKFEEIFSKYAKADKQRLDWKEALEMTEAMRNANDMFGWMASKFEFGFLYLLCADENGFVSKNVMRGNYDGSLFFAVEQARQKEH